ncbi:hydantoinase/oxoprolinase family protein [Chloroflexota bacterium]
MRIGIDIGGTFTDFVVFDPQSQQLQSFKLLSTPGNPAEAMLAGLERITIGSQRTIIHGSTVATNALLESKGAATALITTEGFRDVLQIARQNRPHLYDLFADPPPPLVPRQWRFEAKERVNHKGEIQIPLKLQYIDDLIPILKTQKIESVAISLLFSFLVPSHENQIAVRLEQAGFFVSASNQILPEFREYERTSTTVINAYVSPVLGNYLNELETALKKDKLLIMQSNGGSISPSSARNSAVRCILSGPAGGVVGAQAIGQQAGYERLITFDMGGTSTDVALIENTIQITTDAEVGGYPIRIPIIDIHTVGAGGGSIAQVDKGGALRVGPESAGADPGPACYGRGSLPTTTDANLVLGRLSPQHFLGGEMQLDAEAANRALTKLGEKLSLTAQEAALGVIRVANAHMERALRVISIERGYDPRDFTLISFGGAGGLHAADLARDLSIPQVLVPPQAATLSAYGMLMTDIVKDYTQTVMLPGNTPYTTLETHFQPMIEKGMQEVEREGISKKKIQIKPSIDLRYRGQSFELNIPFSPNLLEDFYSHHQAVYGYANPNQEVEIVNLRLKSIGEVEKPVIPHKEDAISDPSSALIESQPVHLLSGMLSTLFFDGLKLLPGNRIIGPAIIIRPDTTVLIEAQDAAEVDPYLNLIISVGEQQ